MGCAFYENLDSNHVFCLTKPIIDHVLDLLSPIIVEVLDYEFLLLLIIVHASDYDLYYS